MKRIKNIIHILALYFIVILLTGCAGSSQPDLSILNNPKTKGSYNDLKSLLNFKNKVIILVPKSNEKYKKFKNEIIKDYMVINVSPEKIEKCSDIHKKMMNLPLIHIGKVESNPLPLLKKYSNCLGVPADARILKITDMQLLLKGKIPIRKLIAGMMLFSVYTDDIFYFKIISTQPSVWLDRKLWANYLEYVIGIDQSKEYPSIFTGYNYRATYYYGDAKNGTLKILDGYDEYMLQQFIDRLYKYKIPFKLVGSDYKMAIINGKIKLVEMFFGLTPMNKSYSKYNLFTEYNPNKFNN